MIKVSLDQIFDIKTCTLYSTSPSLWRQRTQSFEEVKKRLGVD